MFSMKITYLTVNDVNEIIGANVNLQNRIKQVDNSRGNPSKKI